MALYLGSSEINPVETIEVIKEVPTEQDLTLMGNELRRACAWVNTSTTSGQYQAFNFNGISSEPFSATSVSSNKSNTLLIDGKRYTATVQNNKLIFTAKSASDSGYQSWADDYFLYIKDNNLYSSSSSLIKSNITSFVPNICGFDFSLCNIVDGNLYNVYSGNLVSNAGNWIYAIYNNYLNSNGELYNYYDNVWTLLDTNVDKDKISYTGSPNGLSIVGTDNYWYSLRAKGDGTSTKTKESNAVINLKQALPQRFYIDDSNNLKQGSTTYYTLGSSYTFTMIMYGFVIHSNDTLYIYQSGFKTPISKSSCNIIEGVTSGSNDGGCIFFIKYNDSSASNTTVYYTSLGDYTQVYQNYNNSLIKYPITSYTSNSIIVDGKTYIRDTSKDAIFTFIPNELANHTFTDQELCQAYLNAGIIQQNS